MEAHPNGHQTKQRRRPARKANTVVQKVERTATQLVHKGQRAIARNDSFIRKNPKSALGLALGAGLVVGAFANGKYARALAIGIAGYLGKRFF